MSKTNPVPAGYHTITPYLTVKGASELLEFLKAGFGAEVLACHRLPNGTVMNAEVRIGDSMIMMGEAREKSFPAMLYLYVQDCDALYNRAVKAGAKSIMPMTDQFYGDRSGAIEDASGNQWWIASRKEELTPEDLAERAAQARA